MRRIQTVLAATLAVHLLANPICASERENRTPLDIKGGLDAVPTEKIQDEDREGPRRKPLLVVIRSEGENRDQARFDKAVLEVESFRLTAKFYDVVQVLESEAREHPLLAGIPFQAPAAILFDSTRNRCNVAGGRASFRKTWGAMCSMAKFDYETPVEPMLQKSRVLLARFDQVDAAKSALGIKERRATALRAKGEYGQALTLEKDIEKDRAAIEKLYNETDQHWKELWNGVRMRD